MTNYMEALKMVLNDEEINPVQKMFLIGRLSKAYTFNYIEFYASLNDISVIEAFQIIYENESEMLKQFLEVEDAEEVVN